jgi:hypothetical protein
MILKIDTKKLAKGMRLFEGYNSVTLRQTQGDLEFLFCADVLVINKKKHVIQSSHVVVFHGVESSVKSDFDKEYFINRHVKKLRI